VPDRTKVDLESRPRMSLRLRLTLWVTVVFTLIQWLTGGAFWVYQRGAVERVFEERLLERSEAMVAELSQMLPGATSAQLADMAERGTTFTRFDRFAAEVFTRSGVRAVKNGDPVLDPAMLPLERVGVQADRVYFVPGDGVILGETLEGARGMLLATMGTDFQPYVVAVIASDEFIDEQNAVLRRLLMTAALVGPLAAVASGWFIAGIAVAPFERLEGLARQLGPKSLNQSLEIPKSNPEVAALAVELDEARQRIRDAFAAQERFLSNVSHEIKTPISVLMVEADTLDTSGMPEHITEFVATVRQEAQRLGRMVESFLTLTRVEEGHARIKGVRYACNDLVMESIESCAVMAHQNGVTLLPMLLEDEDEIDAATAGEPELLRTMLDNLIRNAIRFSPVGSSVSVLTAITDDDFVEIAVRDHGPGIPEERLANVFDRFAQAGSQPRSGRGHGLGLAIALGIAELHRGSIRVRNLDVGGCEFTVSLPVVPPKA
jgi:signal transduction histidine kinase